MGDLIAGPYDSDVPDDGVSVRSGTGLGTAFAQRDAWRRDILEGRVRYPWQEQPSFAESLIPIWGAARSIVADMHEGDYLSAGINAALTMADLQLLKSARTGLKTGLKMHGPMDWRLPRRGWVKDKATGELDKGYRDWLGKRGYLEFNQHGHHSLLPKRERWMPDFIKNSALNILPMENKVMHMRIHGKHLGMPKFNAFDRYMYGVMPWAKAAQVEIVGRTLDEILDRNYYQEDEIE